MKISDAKSFGEAIRQRRKALHYTQVTVFHAENKVFFDGLLPEGFTRRTAAQWLHRQSL